MEIKRATHLNGEYLDVKFLIINWQEYGRSNWTYYLLLPDIEEMKDIDDAVIHPILGQLPWNGGITFFQKDYNGLMKIGCDFQHSWNDKNISEGEIIRDMKRTIVEYVISNTLNTIEGLEKQLNKFKTTTS